MIPSASYEVDIITTAQDRLDCEEITWIFEQHLIWVSITILAPQQDFNIPFINF